MQVAPKPPGGPSTPPKAGDAVGAVVPPSTPGVAGASPQISGLEWFWLAVSPKLEDSAPGRLQQAMDELKRRHTVRWRIAIGLWVVFFLAVAADLLLAVK